MVSKKQDDEGCDLVYGRGTVQQAMMIPATAGKVVMQLAY
jgi:hypothetical protein